MEFNLSDFPAVPFASERPLVAATEEQLNEMTTTNAAYAIRKGDTIEFTILDNAGKVPVCIQKSQDANGRPTVYIPVMRNGKKSWITGGNLTRRAKDGVVISEFNEKMRTFPTWKELAAELQGKTVKCTEVRSFTFNEWGTNNSVERPCPILTFV